ncbi:unnamed protein product [Angiostrongylus costaricensis]|uniref:3-oxoacyl-[acyl-carrier-protein] reductase n=1 Tax=Angiostrongylus costaricensis TaxID=334426 RepID=A0A0R3PK67_ANGCS|nr:unnamed protein product [Angiostrongylus costaricensis]
MPVAIITGASSGIGRAAAVLFARNRYQLSLNGRNESALKEVVKECIQQGITEDDVVISFADLAVDNAPKSIVDNTLNKFNRIDSLVNSAGILRSGQVLDSDISVYDELFNVNVFSLVRLTREALPHIIQSKGTVVNVSSINGPCPFAGVAYYCMSKSAVDQFTKCLALEMAPYGVRVNAVNPGVTITNLHKRAGQDEKTYAAFLEKSKTTHALGRPCEAKEVAEAILFLASERSSFTTGQLLRVDGASSGIGKGTAVRFAREGYALSLSGRDEEALSETAKLCKEAGAADVIVTAGDLCIQSNAQKLLDNTIKQYQHVHTLVRHFVNRTTLTLLYGTVYSFAFEIITAVQIEIHNQVNAAGILVSGNVIDADLDLFDRQMDVNVRSVVQLTRLVLPYIIKSRGTVVNVSSITGPCAFGGVTYYCMSKSALDQFTKCLALEMAPHGVRVNSVNPGVIVTNVHRRSGMNEDSYREFLEKGKTTHALGRVGEVSEVAEAILFLASDKSSFTTGELLRVDGGRGIMHPR